MDVGGYVTGRMNRQPTALSTRACDFGVEQARYSKRVTATALVRLVLCIAAILVALSVGSGTVEAGIVTSMSSNGMSVVPTVDDDRAPPEQSEFSIFKAQSLFELPQNTGGTSSSSSTSTSGPSHSLAAAANTVLLGGLARSGWITPEAVQALPPLLPSGQFRPPCASVV
jgi:hypothetical protein